MPIRPHLALALATLFGPAPLASGQCTDPPAPRSGFQRIFEKDKPVTYSDGYKTLANVLYPDATPGSCGWPVLVLVHSLNASRNTPSAEAVGLAAAGFMVVTYDVRAQGDARGNNPGKGSKLWALDEWIDLAEIIEWTGSTYPGKADLSRVAVFGDSQGAMHSWAAAAYSGRTLPPNSRRTKALMPI